MSNVLDVGKRELKNIGLEAHHVITYITYSLQPMRIPSLVISFSLICPGGKRSMHLIARTERTFNSCLIKLILHMLFGEIVLCWKQTCIPILLI